MKLEKITSNKALACAFRKMNEIHNPTEEDKRLISEVIWVSIAEEQEKGLESVELLDTYHYEGKEYGKYWGNLYLTLLHYKDRDIIIPFRKVNTQQWIISPRQWDAEKWDSLSNKKILDDYEWKWNRDYMSVYGYTGYDDGRNPSDH